MLRQLAARRKQTDTPATHTPPPPLTAPSTTETDSSPAVTVAAPGSPRAVSEHLMARLRRNALPGLSRAPDDPASVHDTNEPMDPNTQDVWEFFVMPVAQQIQERLSVNALLPVFIVENPFPHYAKNLRNALANLCPALNTYQLDTRVSSNFQDLVIRMAEQRAFGMILFCTSRNQLPREFRSLVRSDGYLSIPMMNAERLIEYAKSRYPDVDVSAVSSAWASAIGPQELLCVNTLSDQNDWLAGLRQLGDQRIQVQSAGASVRLDDLHGVESAKRWARQLFNDVQLAMRSKIKWKEVDRGALFAGPPGTGKTTLARAIALECGIAFTSVAPVKDWMVGNGLDECIQLMSATFAAARQQAPSILFIDEIDSLGNREKFSGQNESWNTAFLNAVLSELDGFDDRDQVIVIGATNHADNVDAALKRAGRLDRVIPISRPDVPALKAIYLAKLRPYAYEISSEDLERCAGLSLGLTGADVELLVRGARRRARMDGNRAITVDDIQDEIFSIPPQAARKPLHGPQLARTAYHEAGHALLGLLIPSLREHVQIASVVSDDQGALGFVGIKSADRNLTRSELLDRICVTLAGRAAEAIMFGEDEVSTGAGGYTSTNDLAGARRLAEAALGVYGFSTSHPNWHTSSPDESEAQALIADQYARAKSMLESQRDVLVAISERLQADHVLDREALLTFIESQSS
ncbi:AAA family ATPase [Bordetella sp. 02P26C-1]|uniref:AAA family ATPase n=1 Tax=Bordetella sp. 02P26C-1 TaxID=2683195 RepID=UPI0013657975|nr:AAA family ATPase [Bordetella sp. 02P26C-1]